MKIESKIGKQVEVKIRPATRGCPEKITFTEQLFVLKEDDAPEEGRKGDMTKGNGGVS